MKSLQKRLNRRSAIRLSLISAAAISSGVIVGACGSDTPTAVSSGTTADNTTTSLDVSTTSTLSAPESPSTATDTTAAKPRGVSPLPSVEVQDVSSTKMVQLASYLPADKPLLVWFWAPH